MLNGGTISHARLQARSSSRRGFLVLCGAGSHAAILLNDNFDSENGGAPTLNYFGFANFMSSSR
jgi:hypothetical protein